MSLTPTQTAAVQTVDRPLAVVAGAGSGKTLVLTERYQYLIDDLKVPVHRILAFTFTEKAANEIKQRILDKKIIRPEDEGFLQVGTVHSFLTRLLRRYGPLLGLDPAFAILNEGEEAVERNIHITNHLHSRLKEKNPAVTEAFERFGFYRLVKIYRKFFQSPHLFVQRQILAAADEEDAAILDDAGGLFSRWLDEKIKSAALTFDDLEILSLRLLRENKETASRIRRRFLHVMVDEFQDTSPLQAQIIETLVEPGVNTLFVVGDPKQSIYRFRRAEASIFRKVAGQITSQGGQIVQLDESFRVPPRLADIINKVCTPLFNEEGISALYHPLVSVHHQTTGELKIVVAPGDKLSIDKLRRLEARWIAQYLKEQNLSAEERERTALLFRTSRPMAIYREELENAGIPVLVTRTRHLLDEPEIRDLMHLLNYLAGNHHLITQTAVLRSGFFNLSEAFIEKYIRNQPSHLISPFTPDLFLDETDQKKWEGLVSRITRWEKLKTALPASNLLKIVVDDLGLLPTDNIVSRLNVEQWLCLMDDIETAEQADLKRLNEIITAIGNGEKDIEAFDVKTAPGCVQLMTMHSAKGLEFERVFLPQLYAPAKSDGADFLFDTEQGVASRKKSPEPARGLKIELAEPPLFHELKEREAWENREEMKRLLYVALTRSQKELVLFLKDPKKKICRPGSGRLADSRNWNEWLWILLEDERREAIHLFTKLDFDDSQTRWAGLATRLEDVLADDAKRPVTSDQGPETKSFKSPVTGHRSPVTSFKPTYTVSEIETFLRCEKEYELRYVYGIRPWTRDQGPGTKSIGSLVTCRLSLVSPIQWGLLIHEIMQFLDLKTYGNQETVIEQALINQQQADPDGKIRKRIEETLNTIRQDDRIASLLASAETSYTELPFIMDCGEFFL
ncbi:MAG: ATP-dependent helicase, partial [Deltaproteobacteria bacterium]|nr:ATP-dependent helicase [Deltaproteobacteria bacterium]